MPNVDGNKNTMGLHFYVIHYHIAGKSRLCHSGEKYAT